MNIVYSDKYDLNLDAHPWHTSKYRLALDLIKKQGLIHPSQILEPPIADADAIRSVHTVEYWHKLSNLDFSREESKKAEIPLTSETVALARRMTGGTILASEQAVEDGLCIHLGGGFHHAFSSHAAGFCLLNDIAISLRVLLQQGTIRAAAVIDCDLHQGDGTAYIFHDDPRVFTLSIHQQDAFPYPKQDSDLDIGLPSGTGDREYLAALDTALARLFDVHDHLDLIHYQAGVDTYKGDLLGRLRLSENGLRERDRRIITTAVSKDIPIVITLGGGYTAKAYEVAGLHANTVVEALLAEQQRGGR
jgi:acetoin utilization deacetylase AcuC-like enzyme